MGNLPQNRTSVAARTLAIGLLGILAQPASGQQHKMQIEQVIGGVNGDTNAQAIQLRMRENNMCFPVGVQVVVYNGMGQVPEILSTLGFLPPDPPPGCQQGDHVLIATEAFTDLFDPKLIPDFLMINTIPAEYLAAGSLTYEQTNGDVLWRLSWG